MTLEGLRHKQKTHAFARLCELHADSAINNWQNQWGVTRWWEPDCSVSYEHAGQPSILAQKDLIVVLFTEIADTLPALGLWPHDDRPDRASMNCLLLDVIPDLLEMLWDRATHDTTLPMRKSLREDAVTFCESLTAKTLANIPARFAYRAQSVAGISRKALGPQLIVRCKEKFGTLGKAAQELGFSLSTLHRWENGIVPSPNNADKLSRSLQWTEYVELAQSVRPKRGVRGKRKMRSTKSGQKRMKTGL